MRLRRNSRSRSQKAISAIVGAVLMIGVTLAVGFAAWAWARGAAQNGELIFGNNIAANMNYLRENFEIVNSNFSSSAPQNVTLWFYNNGNYTVYIKQIIVSNVSSTVPWTATNQSRLSQSNSYANCKYCLQLPIGQITTITLKMNKNFAVGVLYQFKAIGQYGNTYTYQQTR